MRPLRRPVGLPQPKSAVVLPGHRPAPHSAAYVNGISQYLCTCGAMTMPAPPGTAAALWREHLEINVAARAHMMSGEPGQFAGRSIKQRLEDELDVVYARLMQGEGVVAKGDKHYARGLAYSIAMMTNPYELNIQAAKDAAHERWEDAQEDD